MRELSFGTYDIYFYKKKKRFKMRIVQAKNYLLILAIILLICPLYAIAEMRTFSHEEKDYGPTAIPRVWYTRIYDDNTVVVRIVRVNAELSPETIRTCFYETFSLRIIHPNGTVDEKDFELDIQPFNYCLPVNANTSAIDVYTTQYEQSDVVQFLDYYLISKNHILITYHNATDPNDVYSYEEWGMIIDFDGKVLSKTPFGLAFVNETTYEVTPTSRIQLNINREKGFLRVAAIGKSISDMKLEWQQYRVEDDGTFTKLTSGMLELGNLSSLNAVIIATVDEGYAIVYANKTNNNIATDPLSPQGQLSVIPIRYNQTSASPTLLYQTSIPNLAFPILSCDIAFTEIGHVCTLIVSQTDPNGILPNEYFYVKVNFLSSGSVTNLTFTNLNNIIRIISGSDSELDISLIVTNLPFGGYLLTKYLYTSKFLFYTTYMWGYLFGDDINYIPWEFPEPITTNGIFQVLRNNTFLIAQFETNYTNTWQFQVIDLPVFPGDKDKGYSNANIEATFPEIQSSINPNISKVSINFYHPVMTSSGNLSIYQVVGDQQYSLRQLIPGALCSIENDGKTVSANVLESTFSISNGNYFIKVDNNFVRGRAYDEPLLGIEENVWRFTAEGRRDTFALSTTGILRLTSSGTHVFDNLYQNGRQDFFDTLLEELSVAVPISLSRLNIENVHIDNSFGENRYLIFISIKETRDKYDNNVKSITKIINIMVKHKDQTQIGSGQVTRYLDETYGFIPAREYLRSSYE
jgi:hypothetical protein